MPTRLSALIAFDIGEKFIAECSVAAYACHAETYEGGSNRSLVVLSLWFRPREDFLKPRILP